MSTDADRWERIPPGPWPTVLIDPPWPQQVIGKFRRRHACPRAMPYPTLTVPQIASLPVPDLSGPGTHLWLWTTNAHLGAGLDLLARWGFRYMAPITWVKPSGFGAWWIHRTQTLLFAYRPPCRFMSKHHPTVIMAAATRHSRKPPAAYDLIEAVSPGPRLELFARPPVRPGWAAWGDEIEQPPTPNP